MERLATERLRDFLGEAFGWNNMSIYKESLYEKITYYHNMAQIVGIDIPSIKCTKNALLGLLRSVKFSEKNSD